ncbi:hypothetical protein HED22_08510 [Thalassospira sp. HF15]|uniref:tetratricopeptide repeat protein n=1 Tax=Thalassospira sp. HF15 TaxID=2722755 RepID=UPI0014311316|nr:hypothetical protein [Thalassospira sp. HF15]NIY75683.1 hypothetical protein [Thalassospira sp. HF15]
MTEDMTVDVNEIAKDLCENDDKSLLVKRFSDFCALLEEESSRNYELIITDLVAKLPGEQCFGVCGDHLEKIFQNNTLDEKVRYTAFFVYVTYLRRYKHINKARNALLTHEHEFKNFPTYDHLLSMVLSQLGPENLHAALSAAERACDKISDNAGVLHSYAATAAQLLEDFDKPHNSESVLEKALERLAKALKLTPDYPKFYSTQARLFSLNGDFIEAKKAIEKAIDLEPSSGKDYFIRYQDYQAVKIAIKHQQAIFEISKKLSEAEGNIKSISEKFMSDVEKAKMTSIEAVGFFAGVIGLVVSGVSVSANINVSESIVVILFLTAAMVFSFAAFSFIVHGIDNLSRAAFMVLIAIIISIVAIVSHAEFGRAEGAVAALIELPDIEKQAK